nr:MAG: hypothetical protein AM324_09965 [Candidatus Thorarchaeota archaeon SMTZ1-83]
MIEVGCCGYPVARRKYFSKFRMVEIQTTFYNPPRPEVAERWRVEAPKSFGFTLKAWQLITHSPKSPTYTKAKLDIPNEKLGSYGFFRPTPEVFNAWEKTEEIARVLGCKIVVFQSPASFLPTKQNIENMRTFFERIDRKDYVFVWESRGKWRREKVQEVCSDLNLVDCVDPLKRSPTVGEPAYFRLHGKGGYRYRYSHSELQELATLVNDLKDGYVMFNNAYMFEDGLRFLQLLK